MRNSKTSLIRSFVAAVCCAAFLVGCAGGDDTGTDAGGSADASAADAGN